MFTGCVELAHLISAQSDTGTTDHVWLLCTRDGANLN